MPFDSLPITSPAIETLRLGRVSISEKGWAQKRMQDADGRVCLVGSITRHPGVSPWSLVPAIEYLRRAIPVDSTSHIAAWNDARDRTKEDVIAAYDRAIDLAVADQIAAG